jgi:hypothetical protein
MTLCEQLTRCKAIGVECGVLCVRMLEDAA